VVEPIFRTRWRQVDHVATNANAEIRMKMIIQQSLIVQIYHECYGATYRHNKQGQDDLQMEKSIKMKA
jgi:hypothetical protein